LSERLDLGILMDVEQSRRDLRSVEDQRQRVNTGLEQTQQKAKTTWNDAMRVARASWAIFDNIMEMAGFGLSAVSKAIVNSVFLIGQQFSRIAAAEAVTPGMQLAAVITAVQAGFMIASAWQSEQKLKEESATLRNAQQIFHGINMIVGNFAY
jgi:hypothetical protein